MSKRRAVELVPVCAPLRHVFVHQVLKPIVMFAFKQVDKLMDDDIFKAGWGFLHQFKIQPDATSATVACPPASLHLPDANFIGLYSDLLFPFLDKRGQAVA